MVGLLFANVSHCACSSSDTSLYSSTTDTCEDHSSHSVHIEDDDAFRRSALLFRRQLPDNTPSGEQPTRRQPAVSSPREVPSSVDNPVTPAAPENPPPVSPPVPPPSQPDLPPAAPTVNPRPPPPPASTTTTTTSTSTVRRLLPGPNISTTLVEKPPPGNPRPPSSDDSQRPSPTAGSKDAAREDLPQTSSISVPLIIGIVVVSVALVFGLAGFVYIRRKKDLAKKYPYGAPSHRDLFGYDESQRHVPRTMASYRAGAALRHGASGHEISVNESLGNLHKPHSTAALNPRYVSYDTEDADEVVPDEMAYAAAPPPPALIYPSMSLGPSTATTASLMMHHPYLDPNDPQVSGAMAFVPTNTVPNSAVATPPVAYSMPQMSHAPYSTTAYYADTATMTGYDPMNEHGASHHDPIHRIPRKPVVPAQYMYEHEHDVSIHSEPNDLQSGHHRHRSHGSKDRLGSSIYVITNASEEDNIGTSPGEANCPLSTTVDLQMGQSPYASSLAKIDGLGLDENAPDAIVGYYSQLQQSPSRPRVSLETISRKSSTLASIRED
jgi:hypothetical protein